MTIEQRIEMAREKTAALKAEAVRLTRRARDAWELHSHAEAELEKLEQEARS